MAVYGSEETCLTPGCGQKFPMKVVEDVVIVAGQRRVGYSIPRYCPGCRAAYEDELQAAREEIARRKAS